MDKKTRDQQFKEFVGETIKSVDVTSINVVHFHMVSGKIISVDAEQSHFGIPVIQVGNYNENI